MEGVIAILKKWVATPLITRQSMTCRLSGGADGEGGAWAPSAASPGPCCVFSFTGEGAHAAQTEIAPMSQDEMLLAEFERQHASPWSLADLEPLEEEARDSMLGNKLYALVAILEPTRAGKVTGMLLELSDNELLELLLPADCTAGVAALRDNIAEARAVLLLAFEQEEAAAAGASPPPSPPSFLPMVTGEAKANPAIMKAVTNVNAGAMAATETNQVLARSPADAEAKIVCPVGSKALKEALQEAVEATEAAPQDKRKLESTSPKRVDIKVLR